MASTTTAMQLLHDRACGGAVSHAHLRRKRATKPLPRSWLLAVIGQVDRYESSSDACSFWSIWKMILRSRCCNRSISA
jgi:hypothetical protein